MIKFILRLMELLALGANLSFMFLIMKPRKAMRYLAQNSFLYNLLTDKNLPRQSINEFLKIDQRKADQIMIYEPVVFAHYESLQTVDLMCLSLLTKLYSPRSIFEIGTFKGFATLHFSFNSPAETKIYTLDFPLGKRMTPVLKNTFLEHIYFLLDNNIYVNRKNQAIPVFAGTPAANKITLLYGDTADFDFSPYHGKIDLFFIDGAHSYQYVKNDTEAALKCCHPGSLIVWHDYGKYLKPGVTRYLRELSKKYEIIRLFGSSIAVMKIEG